MGLYGRSDVMSVAVPASSGGCGAMHSRPVTDGVPEADWNLEQHCPRCAGALRGDPLWAAMPADVPETPDEIAIREDAAKRGDRALKRAQEELSVRQHELTEKIVTLLERGGTPVQLPDPDLIARLVAQEVQKAMSRPQPAPPEPEPEPENGEGYESVPLWDADGTALAPMKNELFRLHVRTLGKMCRERGLDDSGGKAELIARLAA
jgi:hypothetical protein